MVISLLVEVFIKAFLLCILIYIVARDEADYEFRKVSMVTAGIVLGAVILDATLTRFIGLFTIIPITAFIVFMIMQFCWVRFWKALLIAVPFLILNGMISTAAMSFQKKADAAIARGLQGPVKEEDMKEAMSFFRQTYGSNALPAPERRPSPEVEESLQDVIFKTLMAKLASKQGSFKKAGSNGAKIRFIAPDKAKTEDQKKMDAKPLRIESEKSEPDEDASSLTATTAPDWQEAENKIIVKGTLTGKDGIRVAIVNSQVVKEGECLQVEHRKTIYRWRARFIRDGAVSWEPVEAVPR